MGFKVILKPEAETDITEIYQWYEVRVKGLGGEFLRAVDACLSSIKRHPLAFPILYKDTRRALLRKFPYGIFFLIENNKIVVIASFHVRREPKRWRDRI